MKEIAFGDKDIWEYLARLRDDDTIGLCAHSTRCLIAQAVMWKYPGEPVVVDPIDDPGIAIGEMELPLTLTMHRIIDIFDHVERSYQPVTKKQFMDAWEARQKVFRL